MVCWPHLPQHSLGWPLQLSQWCGRPGWERTQHPELEEFPFLIRHTFTEHLSTRYCLGTLPKMEPQRPKTVPSKGSGARSSLQAGMQVSEMGALQSSTSRDSDWQLSHISVYRHGIQNTKTRSYKPPEEKTGHTQRIGNRNGIRLLNY